MAAFPYAGEFQTLTLTGATAGWVTFAVPVSVTSYNLIFPNAQGTAGYGLVNDGSGNLSWAKAGGDVDGPASATDKALVRFDGITGKLIQNSGVILSNANALTAGDGTVSLPTYSFASDPNTGIYSRGADQLGFATGGVAAGFIDASGNWVLGATTSSSIYGKGGELILNQASTAAKACAIYQTLAEGSVVIGGGNSSTNGANIFLGGGSHATLASVINFRQGSTVNNSINASGTFYSAVGMEVGPNASGTTGTNVVFSVRKDLDGQVRTIFKNGSSGSTAYVRNTLNAADDFDFTATSTANGAAASITAGSGFTGGLTINMQGTNSIVFRTNSTTAFSISGAQVVTIGTGTSSQHVLNSLLAANGSGVMTMTNGPVASANATGWLQITINGSTRYIPFWG